MNKTCLSLLAYLTLSSLGVASLPAATVPTATPAKTAAAVTAPREYGGKMPLPVDQRLERQNGPADKLLVEVTHSTKEGASYVAYVKIVWGDLNNVLKGVSPQYYSNWDGSLKLATGTGLIDQRIQFDQGAAKKPLVATLLPKINAGPRVGTGRDQIVTAAGSSVTWKAAVVGVIDGLRIKITSPTPNITATLVAGKFTLPITITPTIPTPALPAPPVPTKGAPLPNTTTLQLKPRTP